MLNRSPVSRRVMSLDCGEKPEKLQRTHTNMQTGHKKGPLQMDVNPGPPCCEGTVRSVPERKTCAYQSASCNACQLIISSKAGNVRKNFKCVTTQHSQECPNKSHFLPLKKVNTKKSWKVLFLSPSCLITVSEEEVRCVEEVRGVEEVRCASFLNSVCLIGNPEPQTCRRILVWPIFFAPGAERSAELCGTHKSPVSLLQPALNVSFSSTVH